VKDIPVVQPEAPVTPRAQAGHRFELAEPADTVVGRLQVTAASREDTLPDIARRFNLGFDELSLANPDVDPWDPGAGHKIVLPTEFVLPDAPHEGLVINIAAMRLYYYPKPAPGARQVVITHPIGIGRVGWRTPEGVTKIVARERNPVWVVPPSIRKEHRENGDPLPARVPPGPDNPLGEHLFRLSWPTYLIHGTNKPYGVGMRSSHGCLRLYPEDIAILFDLVPIGTPVRIVNQPVVLGWRADRLMMQAFEPLEDDRRAWKSGPRAVLKHSASTALRQRLAPIENEVDWALARSLVDQPRGIVVPVRSRDHATLATLLATAAEVRNELPIGATWSGDGDGGDGEQFEQVIDDREKAASSIVPAKP
jgi:L,D-transpeptidase ErfK/SrfK